MDYGSQINVCMPNIQDILSPTTSSTFIVLRNSSCTAGIFPFRVLDFKKIGLPWDESYDESLPRSTNLKGEFTFAISKSRLHSRRVNLDGKKRREEGSHFKKTGPSWTSDSIFVGGFHFSVKIANTNINKCSLLPQK